MKTYQNYSVIFLALIFLSTISQADITPGTTSQASAAIGGQTPAGSSGSPQLSGNGRYLVFRSNANNLVANDTNGSNDVFQQELTASGIKSGSLTRLSVNAAGEEGDDASTNPAVTSFGTDGFYAVAFQSNASNLGSLSDSNSISDIYIRLPKVNRTERVSVGISGAEPNGTSSNPSIAATYSPNRLLVVFESSASNLVTGDNAGNKDIFLASVNPPGANDTFSPTSAVTISRITRGASGAEANDDSDSAVISGNGQYIVFVSSATNLISGLSTSGRQVYLHDRIAGTTTLISKNGSGSDGDGDSFSPSISYNGRYVAFITQATDIISGNSSADSIAVRFDRDLGTFTRVNTSSAGVAGNGNVSSLKISPAGRFAMFSDSSTNLVSNDNATLEEDIFVKDLVNGAIARLSVNSSGQDADNDSDSAFAAAQNYNSLNTFATFRSFASDLTTTNSNGAGDVFFKTATLDRRTLTSSTKLEVPADATTGKGKATIIGERFASAASATLGAAPAQGASLLQAGGLEVRYEFSVRSTRRGGTRALIVSKRNNLTLKNLKAGTYIARYRALRFNTSTGKTVSKTPQSPPLRIVVR